MLKSIRDPSPVRVRITALVVALVGTFFGVAATSAYAAAPVCGGVITTNTKLEADLDCSGYFVGLTIEADNVTLDLGGHTLYGNAGGDTWWDGTAIVIRGDGVTVRNGRTEGWMNNGVMGDGDRIALRNLDTWGAEGYGARLSGRGNLIADSRVGGGSGTELIGTDATVVRSDLWGHYTHALYVAAPGSSIRSSTITGEWSGMWVVASDVAVVGNEVRSSNPHGIVVPAGPSRVLIARNRLVENLVDGLHIEAPGTLVRDNVANSNGGWGIYAVDGVIDAGRNKAFGNGEPTQCFNIVCQ